MSTTRGNRLPNREYMLPYLLCIAAILVPTEAKSATEAELVFLVASRSTAVIKTDAGALGSAVAYFPFEEKGTGLLTNCHVLKGSREFRVFHKGRSASGFLMFGDPKNDICLVGTTMLLPVAEPRSFSSVKVGETVYAVGAPRGLELSISNGIVSQLRGDPIFEPPLLIQTTAPISPGSSGGGLFDAKGRLIGLTSFQYRDSQSLNFAISVNMANGITDKPMKSLKELDEHLEH